MNKTMYDLALCIGQMCTFASLLLCCAAAFLPMNLRLRQELKSCVTEASNSGILFLIFAWIFGVQTSAYQACVEWLARFALLYMIVFLVLIVGGALLNTKQSIETQKVGRELKKSALIYGIVFFALAVLLG